MVDTQDRVEMPALQPEQRKPVALLIFASLWGQLSLAHALLELDSDWRRWSWKPLPAVGAAVALFATLQPRVQGSLPLVGLINIAVLVRHGSRSNHTVQDLFINIAILLSLPLGVAGEARWSHYLYRLGHVVHHYLIALYAVSALHKMNADFFDTRVSCAASTTGTMLAQYAPSVFPADSWGTRLLLWSSPHAACVLEVLLPALFAYAGPPGSHTRPLATLCHRAAVSLGVIFHLMLALPLPPGSFYPFSASCLSLYVLVVPEAWECLVSWCRPRLPSLGGVGSFILPATFAPVLAVAKSSHWWSRWVKAGEESKVPFEYPPYDLYDAGVAWCFSMALMLSCALCAQCMSRPTGEAPGIKPPRWGVALCAGGCLFLGVSPYMGLRTYPAFAMFSNLRVEGARPNHVLLGGGIDLLGFQEDVATVISPGDSAGLRNFQVDLSVLFTPHTLRFLTMAGLEPALWIVPPKWRHPAPANFTQYSAPVLQLQRRLRAEEEASGGAGAAGAQPREPARVVRRGQELRVYSSADLEPRCGAWMPPRACEVAKAIAGPYRAYDDGESPCRH